MMLTDSKILNGKTTLSECFPDDLSAEDLAHFKFTPITSVDVECSFLNIIIYYLIIVVH